MDHTPYLLTHLARPIHRLNPAVRKKHRLCPQKVRKEISRYKKSSRRKKHVERIRLQADPVIRRHHQVNCRFHFHQMELGCSSDWLLTSSTGWIIVQGLHCWPVRPRSGSGRQSPALIRRRPVAEKSASLCIDNVKHHLKLNLEFSGK